jgi:hypothetical protein
LKISQHTVSGIRGPSAGAGVGSDSPDEAEVVTADAELLWLAGYRAASCDLYFGTDPGRVASAGRGSAELAGNLTTNVFTPTGLQPGRKHDWRVDSVSADGTIVKGEVWTFTVGRP